MVFIDPDRDGCTIWYAGTVQTIRGTVVECAERIMKNFINNDGVQFYDDIYLDAIGIGCAYADYFHYRNFKFQKVTRGNLIK